MAYYDALIAAWNGATQPPSGAAGTAIVGGMTTAQKLAAVNSWTVAGTVTYSKVQGSDVQNCIVLADWNAITDAQRSQVGTITGASGGIDPTPGKFAAAVLGSIFAGKATTLNALVALQNSVKSGSAVPWWQANGYARAFDIGDVTAAGLS